MLPSGIVRVAAPVNALRARSRSDGRQPPDRRPAALVEPAQPELVGQLQRPLELIAIQVPIDLRKRCGPW
jgi:hypothetical protein